MTPRKDSIGDVKHYLIVLGYCLFLGGCAATQPPPMSPAHLNAPAIVEDEIPQIVNQAPILPPPAPEPKLETYTVVVSEVPLKALLFELARDANINLDMHPGIEGTITLNAINQTLPQILNRIARQTDLRYQFDGTTMTIGPDTPYWRTYAVNYVNMSRDSVGEVSVATQISTAGGSVSDQGGSSKQGNVSVTTVKNNASNHFWDIVEANIRAIITPPSAEGTAATGEGGQTIPSSSVISNPVSGVITVQATQRQHEQIQGFLDQVLSNALRQVLIEMTIVEVELGDHYQAGIDWQSVANGDGLTWLATLTGANLSTPPVFSVGYEDTASSGRSFSATLKMLETFGDVQVLSSPKIMALNNQTALLKVVDEKVYFTVDLEIQERTNDIPERRTYISEIHTVPVGMVMSVTPQINADNYVTLNIRPTISRITGYATDPAPRLAESNFDNLIPEIQVREMESLLQVANEQMVVMGGLMQNKTNKINQGLPLLSKLPLVGNLFSYRDEEFTKTELVIFLRPTVIKGAGVDFNLAAYQQYLPKSHPQVTAQDTDAQPLPEAK